MKRPVGAGIILINSKKEILLNLRDDIPEIPYPGMWDLPGGHPEGDESPEECVRREMMEEMELDLGEFHFFKKCSWPTFDEYIFWKQIDLIPSEIPLHEGQKLAYFTFEEIKKTKLAFHYNELLPEFYDSMKF